MKKNLRSRKSVLQTPKGFGTALGEVSRDSQCVGQPCLPAGSPMLVYKQMKKKKYKIKIIKDEVGSRIQPARETSPIGEEVAVKSFLK